MRPEDQAVLLPMRVRSQRRKLAGQRAGRYKTDEKTGEGGLAHVFVLSPRIQSRRCSIYIPKSEGASQQSRERPLIVQASCNLAIRASERPTRAKERMWTGPAAKSAGKCEHSYGQYIRTRRSSARLMSQSAFPLFQHDLFPHERQL